MRGLLCLFWVSVAVAQPGAEPWGALRSRNPSGVEITLRLLREGSYRQGELIRADVHYPVETRTPRHLPREQWQSNGFLMDPAGVCGTPASPCFPWFPQGGVVSGNGLMSNSPLSTLNNFLRPLRPGRYRAAALMRKLVLTNSMGMSSSYGYAEPAQYLVSNTIEFEVVAASPEWIAQAIAASIDNLKGPEPNSREANDARRLAAEQLRFLDSPAAWRASLELMPAAENVLLEGLSASTHSAQVCELMRAAIPAPGQAVSNYYLDNLSRICAAANLPAPPQATAEQSRYWTQWAEYRQSVMGQASTALAASLPAKVGRNKTIAIQTLISYVAQTQADRPPQPMPGWIPALQSEFIRSYASLEGWQQRQLLSMFTNTLRSRDLIPLLESVLDGWKPNDYYEASHEAIANLYALDPARAQARIVAELKKDRTWLNSPQLALLPPAAARITDDELIDALASAQKAGGWNIPLRMTAVARYASPEALPRVKKLYEFWAMPRANADDCQPELMAYFVRVEPAYADRIFHSHAWDMQSEPPPCTVRYFERTPQIAMGPVLEKYMAAYLMHRTVRVKKSAAQSLGKYGSAAAVEPLWAVFRYFHEYWKGKEAQLADNGEGVGLEMELRNAIARGRHWLATDADLRTIESLCVSGRCLQETRQDLQAWQSPLRLELRSDGVHGTVAQYYDFESLQDIEEKLGQFPKGTQFALKTSGPVDDAAAELRKYAAGHGLTIISR